MKVGLPIQKQAEGKDALERMVRQIFAGALADGTSIRFCGGKYSAIPLRAGPGVQIINNEIRLEPPTRAEHSVVGQWIGTPKWTKPPTMGASNKIHMPFITGISWTDDGRIVGVGAYWPSSAASPALGYFCLPGYYEWFPTVKPT